ncbi:uncharacterized protein LOC135085872 [Ostrinia nubilalis]|uniref:uncharacterized protein LOC135085872 n=1 Tax=Ostrinia nubilalis TaxID=29057 RepID=UPI00308236DF
MVNSWFKNNPYLILARTACSLTHNTFAGLTHARSRHDAFSSHKRSYHDYSRNANFENALKKYESPEKNAKKHPKCKISLNNKLKISDEVKVETLDLQCNASSRSSLYSIPSIEWDGRCKSEYAFKTRSLPRQRVSELTKLYRTRSHSGFVNNYVKYPEPTHYHLPRCRSCGATNNSYAWEIRENKKLRHSLYFSVDDIPQKCIEEATNINVVKVEEKVVPVFKVAKVEEEFVESQEFNEDNYLGELGNSFSSQNETIIEKDSPEKEKIDDTLTEDKKNDVVYEDDVYRAECVQVEEHREIDEVNNNTVESIEGEYHSFTDELDFEEAVYESPVKDLVEKDIRDYSVPINFYCDDYAKKEDSPKKSPQKRRDIAKSNATILEPILEESKSSYDDSNNSVDKEKGPVNNVSNIIEDVITKAVSAVELKDEIGVTSEIKITTEMLETEYVKQEYFINDEESDITTNDLEIISTNIIQTAIDAYKETETVEDEVIESVYDDIFDILASEAASTTTVQYNPNFNDNKDVRSSLYSVSSGVEVLSFDSTVEFEKLEVISDIIASILNRIDYNNNKEEEFFNNVENRVIRTEFEIDAINNNNIESIVENVEVRESVESENSDTKSSDSSSEFFSIKKIIDDIETNVCLNETVSTENSELEINQTNKIVEAIIYYVFNAAFFACTKKNKAKKDTKKVVTVVDSEDILLTAIPLWDDDGINTDLAISEAEVESTQTVNQDVLTESNLQDANDLETCLNNDKLLMESDRFSHDVKVDNESELYNGIDFNITYVTEKSATDKTYLCEEHDNYNYHEDPDDTDCNSSMNDESEIPYITNDTETEEQRIRINQIADAENFLNETFVMDSKSDMNTAFFEDQYSRCSSPNRESKAFESCTESPIRNNSTNFAGDDLSVLYEKDDTILGSPFVKKAPVISMSQTEHSGGIKYWLSFDNSLTEMTPVKRYSRQFDDNKVASFVSVNDDEDFEGYKRSGVLQEKYNDSQFTTDSFTTACASNTDYNTCESNLDSKIETESNQKRLLYDSRDLKRSRKYSSWPPIDDSLFYRIISKFRMSESFDPSDLEATKLDNSY